MDLSKYGHAISDCDGQLRDITSIVADLKEVNSNFSTHAMSDHKLYLQGQKDVLVEIIKFLERV